MDEDALGSYLYFGAAYGDVRDQGRKMLSDCETSRYRHWAATASPQQLAQEGVRALREATQQALGRTSEERHGVFLSAGFDSRAVLGCLLEQCDASDLVALTFGTPGSLDYEIPARLANYAGIRHERLDATTVPWNTESVAAFACRELALPAPEVDGEFIAYNLWSHLEPGMASWTGYLGGPMAGSRLPPEPSRDWDQAVTVFLRRNRQAKSVELTTPGWDVRELLPDTPIVDERQVGFDDQLELAGRQSFRIGSVRRTHQPVQLLAESSWKSFMLAVPLKHRLAGSPLYHRILRDAFPQLFRFPVQGDHRRSAGVISPRSLADKVVRRGQRSLRRRSARLSKRWRLRNVQKLDYEQLLLTDSAYAAYVHTALEGLAARGILDHLDIPGMWSEHRAGTTNHTEALRLLSSLEMNLQASELSS